MGNSLPTRLNVRTLSALKNGTAFTKDEIRALYKTFMQLSGGSGYITPETFFEGLKRCNLYTNDDQAQEGRPSPQFFNSLFYAFDHNKSKSISLREFCTALSVFATNTLEDTLQVAFDLYDLAGDQWITEGEMVEAMRSMNAALELPMFSTSVSDNKLQTDQGIALWVANIFSKFDKGTDPAHRRLRYEDFAAAVKEHPLLVNLAAAFVTECCQDFFACPDRLKSSHVGAVLPPSGIPNDISGVPVTEEQLRALFNGIDADGNGYITKDEFRMLYESLDSMGVEDDPDRLESVLTSYKALGDHKLSYEEFAVLMLKISQW